MLVSVQFLLLLFLCQSLGAPSSAHRGRSGESDDDGETQNPFSSGPEQLKILQQYLKHSDLSQENASSLKRETAILHIFLLHDYDKSGHLDGLELMQLLSGILSERERGRPPSKSVIFLVDEVLEKQDLNRDGLLSAPELLVPPVYASQSLTEDPSTDTIHVAIPPPQGTLEDGTLEAQENLVEVLQAGDQDSPPQDTNGQSDDRTPSPAEANGDTPKEPGAEENEELNDETLPEKVEEEEEQGEEEIHEAVVTEDDV
ncbi:cell growth regulator with EF hand domain protein 1 isoform X2 [Spea bombifrons]|nr:cell growth regulator with EF hand domain protein 1 isoform X2 [Spea bombifrons]